MFFCAFDIVAETRDRRAFREGVGMNLSFAKINILRQVPMRRNELRLGGCELCKQRPGLSVRCREKASLVGKDGS